MHEQRIGFLGAGNMSGALIRGILASKLVKPEQVRASDLSVERLSRLEEQHGIKTTRNNLELVQWASILVFAVKPQAMGRVLDETANAFDTNTIAVSVAAGVPISVFEQRLPPGTHVVRSMPNTAAIALAGATAIAPGKHATDEDIALTKQLFEAVGRCVVLDETLIDAVTGLSGSGPAYIMLMIEALADGGVKVGLHRETALLLAAQTVFGSAKLLLDTGEHPGRLKDMVTSPGGTAIAGLHTLESGGLRRTLIDAVESATTRAQELGAQIEAKLCRGAEK